MSVQVLNTSASLSGKTLATLEGTQTFAGDKTFGNIALAGNVAGTLNLTTGGIQLVAGNGIILDHGTDNSVITGGIGEIALTNSASSSKIIFESGNSGAQVRVVGNSAHLALTAASRLYLDGTAATGDTYIAESSANVMALVSGSVTVSITSGVMSMTKQLNAASAGTAVSGYVDGLNLAGFDMVGFESVGGVRAVFGGYRAAQWTQVGLATSGTEWVRLSTDGGFGLKDGITAPATLAGFAVLYVDTADGDLKIKFGDGTVKTIVVDT